MSIAEQGNTKRAFLLAISLAIAAFLAIGTASASAEVRWQLGSSANTTVAPGDGDVDTAELRFHLFAKDTGDTSADGSLEAVRFTGTMPAGMTFVGVHGFSLTFECPTTSVGDSAFSCESTGFLAAHEGDFITLEVSVATGASGVLTGGFEFSGGGQPTPATTADPTRIAAFPPGFGIDALDVGIGKGRGGEAFTRAGGHPYDFTTSVDFNTHTDPDPYYGDVTPVEPTRDAYLDLPPGLIGNPTAVGECTLSQLTGDENNPLCPASSQVGVNTVRFNYGTSFAKAETYPLFNMVPPPGSPARFGFNAFGTMIVFDPKLRSDGDYGLTATFTKIPEGLVIIGSSVDLWGVPGDSAHDSERACPGNLSPALGGPTCPSGASPAPFLRMPTSCNEGRALTFPFQIDSWFNPGALGSNGLPLPGDPNWKSASVATHEAPGYPFSPADPSTPWGPEQGLEGCSQVPVKGRLAAQPTSLDTETSSGLEVEVEVPNPGMENPTGIASSDIEGVKLTLPQGMTINPSQAEGLGVCAAAQYASTELSFHPDGQHGCPSDSKIGTVSVKTPLLNEPLPGDVYVAKPYDNPFNSLLALYIVIEEPQRGILVKLPGEIRLNEETGRIEAEFNDIPQVPFTTFSFHFREGARAPLATPPTCGTYESEAIFTPRSDPGKKLVSTSNFQIVHGIGGGPCPPGGTPAFKPLFSAGAINNNAASYSPFDMRIQRNDGEQDMTRFSAVLPPGVLGKLAGVAKCPIAAIAVAKAKSGNEEIANPSCPAGSQIGRSLVGAGVGSVLTYVPGKVYLGGPFHGDPLSVIAITPVVAGPFDVGTVAVHEALTLNPKTAEVEVDGSASDPIPHILKGIPAKLRDLRVYVDRQDFTLNPTSCDPSATNATLFGGGGNAFTSLDDVPVSLSDRFQAAGCGSLGFKPNLALHLKGGTKRGGHPALQATYKPRSGDANVKGLVVRLPRSAFLDQAHIRTICTRVQFAAKQCPPKAQYGYIKAWTPLLEEPLEGPVWLRSSDHKLPDLVFDLHGLVDIEVATRIDSIHGGVRASVGDIPDAPLSKVVLKMQGAKKGLIVNSRDLCGSTNKANAQFEGQNGKEASLDPVMRADCGGKRKHKRHVP
jgi:hypothetical protein